MENIHTLHLRILQGQLAAIAQDLTRVRHRPVSSVQAWLPRINVHALPDRLVICAELAGIDRGEIELRVEPHRVWLAGWRRFPAQDESREPLRRILALEIDEGRFEREILLPTTVEPEQVRAEQRNGLLWIDLPLAAQD